MSCGMKTLMSFIRIKYGELCIRIKYGELCCVGREVK